jgi:hypothetical protein
MQGVKSCRKLGLDVDKYIFIAPPSMDTLEKRLRGRGASPAGVRSCCAIAARGVACAQCAGPRTHPLLLPPMPRPSAGTETEERLRRRLDGAVRELEEAKGMAWDAYIVNDDVHAAYAQLRQVLAEGREQCVRARDAATAREVAAAAAPMPPPSCPHHAAAMEKLKAAKTPA